MCGFFLRQGHAAPALYSMWVEAGFLKESELLSLCNGDSTMEVHAAPVRLHIYCPTHSEACHGAKHHINALPCVHVFQKHQLVDIATGSLGQGLGVACGMAYTGKYFDKSRYSSNTCRHAHINNKKKKDF